MSAGHRNKQIHSDTDRRELRSLLSDKDVKAYLTKPYTVDTSKHIPLTGGSNIAGNKYYIDRSVPKRLQHYILWHERVEKALRAVKGMSYDRAHTLATLAEKIKVEAHGHNWIKYKDECESLVRKDEKEGGRGPKDLDPVPHKG